MGWVLLFLLTGFALVDAVALAIASRPRGRAELGIATALFFAALLGGPVLVLGYDAPPPGVGGTNGYPKLCEGLCLWFVIFTDKALIELPATLFVPPLMLAVYGLARRFVDRVCAVALAVVLLLVPHTWRQFCSTCVDVEMAFFLLAATYYASREKVRDEDLVMCTLAMALAAATKTTWLMFVPPVALVAYVRRVQDRSDPARSTSRELGRIALSAAVVGVAGGVCLARNFAHYGNPVWPVAYDIPKLGIHWPGIARMLQRQKEEELGPGDEVVFSEGIAFPGPLWNFEFSNRVDYVPFTTGPALTAKLAERSPKWVCVGASSSARKVLEGSGQWALIGRTNPGLNEVAFRRKGAAAS